MEGLALAAMLVPIYWAMMSIAAVKAMWQLVVTPSFWEKTAHGLDAGATLKRTRTPFRSRQKGSAWSREVTWQAER